MSRLTSIAGIESPAHSSSAHWSLEGRVAPDEPVRSIRIITNPYSVGRNADNSLCISDNTVSSRHAELMRVPDGLVVRDLGSTNGTYVNARRIGSIEFLDHNDLVQFGGIAFRVICEQVDGFEPTMAQDVTHDAVALVQFGKILHDSAVWPNFQPIVDIHTGRPMGYEVLARSRMFGLETAGAMFEAAARLKSEVELSRLFQNEGLRAATPLPLDMAVFLNTHPNELADDELLDALAALRNDWPERPLVLEIHESAITRPEQLHDLREALNALDIKLAYDDFGSGQARLLELIEVLPDYLKFDLGLIRNIHETSSRRRQVVEALVRMTRELGVVTVAEGVEREEELAVCRELGFELCQGYIYGRPAPAGAWPHE